MYSGVYEIIFLFTVSLRTLIEKKLEFMMQFVKEKTNDYVVLQKP